MGPAVGKGFVASFSISYQGGCQCGQGQQQRQWQQELPGIHDQGHGYLSEASLQHGPCSKTRYKAFEGDHDQTSDNMTNLLNLHVCNLGIKVFIPLVPFVTFTLKTFC